LNVKGGFLGIFSFYGRYLTLLRLPPLRFHRRLLGSNTGLLRLWH
jgi:hypothetical protein